MRTGGAGFSHSSEPSHAASNAGPAVSIGAMGWSIFGGVFCSGMEMIGTCAAIARNSLANIAGAVDVDDAAGSGSRRFGRKPADHFGDLVGACDTPQRDVGDDLGPAAPLQIVLGHLGHGEAGRHREGEDALPGIAARDALGHADHSGLGGRIMPVLRRVAAIGGAAGDVDDAPDLALALAEMVDGEAT